MSNTDDNDKRKPDSAPKEATTKPVSNPKEGVKPNYEERAVDEGSDDHRTT